MDNKPSEEELRDMLKEGKTLYQISRQFNTKIPEIFKLGKDHNLVYPYQIPKPTKQDLESMYTKECMTQEQIAKEFGISRSTVRRWFINYNIQVIVSKMPSKEVLERKYIYEGMTQYQISQEFDVVESAVNTWLNNYNISTVGRMGSKIPIPPKEVIERMYSYERMTQKQIGKKFNVAERTVSTWICKYNIIRCPEKEVIERMYSYERMTQKQIASEFNVSTFAVHEWIHKYNIPTRGIGTLRVPMPPIDELQKHVAEGLNQHQIAQKYKVCDATIFKWCEYYVIHGMVNNFRCTTPEHIEWRDKVFARDNYICQECGKAGCVVHPHHIKPYHDYPELELDVDNGITLCKECHENIRGREYQYIVKYEDIVLRDRCIGDDNYD